MAVLVTGGAGYIGSHTCVELINAGQDVVILDNFYNCKHSSLDRIRALVDRDFKFYECDIRDREGLNKVFEYCSAAGMSVPSSAFTRSGSMRMVWGWGT